MKECPFCREEIRDGAIKCRYCGSSLLPQQPAQKGADDSPPPSSNQIVYVLDRDLVRFVKVAGTFLAFFVTASAVLVGFNVKETGDKVSGTYDKVKETAEKIRQDQAAIETQVRTVQDAREQVLKTSQEIASYRSRIQALVSQSEQESQQIHGKYLEVVRLNFAFGPSAADQSIHANPVELGAAKVFTVPQVARLYDFPTELDGKGQTIGFIELGGGYRESDLDTYFGRIGVTRPKVSSVSIAGAKNSPGDSHAGAQVTLDIEVAGSVAHQANIIVYFAPNTAEGLTAALSGAIHDQVNRPGVISVSWGSPESLWSSSDVSAMESLLRDATKLGITVVAAAGDSGVTDGMADGKAHVDFPASSPYVLAVGGTHLAVSDDKVTSEVVWNSGVGATGGGFSDLFPRPEWQAQVSAPAPGIDVSRRGLPDVSANADPVSGYGVVIQGQYTVVGGTAAATPFWAGLVALLNQGVGRNIGYINPVLYHNLGPAGVLRNIATGNNSIGGVAGYSAGPGWSPVAGWGSPRGRALVEALR